jgi:CBS domain-containing protein
MTGDDQLKEIARQVEEGQTREATVRELLSWFGGARRSYWNVYIIKSALKSAKLRTEPDFESAYIDSKVKFVHAAEESAELVNTQRHTTDAFLAAVEHPDIATISLSTVYADPTYRISKLEAANRQPQIVAPDAVLNEAVTVMLEKDYSQLPVMTNEREVKGIITWTSIGSRLALGKTGTTVRELMDQHYQEIRIDASLFSAISIIAEHQYVLIRGRDQRITGIVTASDLSLQFRQLAEPFLLLGEIENHIRRIISTHFTGEALKAIKDPSDPDRTINGVEDLAVGEYVCLLEKPERWAQLRLAVDRKEFVNMIEGVRVIRNDVMHFDPDGIPDSDLKKLRECAQFFQRLQILGVT